MKKLSYIPKAQQGIQIPPQTLPEVIIYSDTNNSRYKAYQDSLKLYNLTQFLRNPVIPEVKQDAKLFEEGNAEVLKMMGKTEYDVYDYSEYRKTQEKSLKLKKALDYRRNVSGPAISDKLYKYLYGYKYEEDIGKPVYDRNRLTPPDFNPSGTINPIHYEWLTHNPDMSDVPAWFPVYKKPIGSSVRFRFIRMPAIPFIKKSTLDIKDRRDNSVNTKRGDRIFFNYSPGGRNNYINWGEGRGIENLSQEEATKLYKGWQESGVMDILGKTGQSNYGGRIKFRKGGIIGDPPGGGKMTPKEDFYWRYRVYPKDEAEKFLGKNMYPQFFDPEGWPEVTRARQSKNYLEAIKKINDEQAWLDAMSSEGKAPKNYMDARTWGKLMPYDEETRGWIYLGGMAPQSESKHINKVYDLGDYARMAGKKIGEVGRKALRFSNILVPGPEDMRVHPALVPFITGQPGGLKPVQFRKGGRIPKGQTGIDIPPIIGSDNTRVATSIKAKDLQKLIRQEQIGDVRSEIEQLYPQFAVKESTPTGEIRATNRIAGGITDPRINYAPMGFDPVAGILVKPQVIEDAINIATLPTAVIGLGAGLGYGAVKLARPVAEYASQVAKLPLKRGLSKQVINYTLRPFPFRKGIASNEYGRIFQEELGKYSPFHPYSQRLREFGEPKLGFMYNYRRPAGEFIEDSYKIKYDLTIPYEEMAPVMKHEIRHAAQFGKRPESSNLLVHDNRARWDDFLAKHPYEFKKSTPDFSNFSKKSKTYINDLNFKKAQKVYLDEEKLMESKIDDYLSPYKMNDLDEKFINYFSGRKNPFVAKVEGMDDKLRKRAFWPISDDVRDEVARRHYDYLTSSHEVDAYMVNAKDKLIEMGLIKSRRDPVTWEMLDKAFKAKGAYSERFYPELIADKYAFVEMVNRLK